MYTFPCIHTIHFFQKPAQTCETAQKKNRARAFLENKNVFFKKLKKIKINIMCLGINFMQYSKWIVHSIQ